jgi:phosphoglycolate phosphatase-like HAD superfamily hydrolase
MDAVIFDKSGTLDDDRMPVYLAIKDVMARRGYDVGTLGEWADTTKENIFDWLKERGIHEGQQQIYAEYKKEYKKHSDNGHPPVLYPDVPSVLESLMDRGFQLALLSSHPSSLLEAELERYRIREYFSLVKGDSARKSVDLVKMCGEIDICPWHAAYVGDTVYDMRAAKAAGLLPIAVATGYHSRERLGKENVKVIASLSALLQVF